MKISSKINERRGSHIRGLLGQAGPWGKATSLLSKALQTRNMGCVINTKFISESQPDLFPGTTACKSTENSILNGMVLNENNLRKHGALTSRQVALTFKPWHSTHSPTSFKLRLHSLEQSLPDSSLVRNEAEGLFSCPSGPAEYEGGALAEGPAQSQHPHGSSTVYKPVQGIQCSLLAASGMYIVHMYTPCIHTYIHRHM